MSHTARCLNRGPGDCGCPGMRRERVGYTDVRVLPMLEGKVWDEVAASYLRSLRPSAVRLVIDGEVEKSDALLWRVTVRLKATGRVREIEQEVEVDLPDGIAHGHALNCRLFEAPP